MTDQSEIMLQKIDQMLGSIITPVVEKIHLFSPYIAQAFEASGQKSDSPEDVLKWLKEKAQAQEMVFLQTLCFWFELLEKAQVPK